MERDGLASSAGAAPAPPVGRALGKSFTRRRDAAGPRAAPARLHGLRQHHLHHPVPSPLSISGYRVASPRGWRRDGRANTSKHSLQFARDETSNVKKELNRVLGTLDSCAAALEPRGGCVLPGLTAPSGEHRCRRAAQQPHVLSRGCGPAAASSRGGRQTGSAPGTGLAARSEELSVFPLRSRRKDLTDLDRRTRWMCRPGPGGRKRRAGRTGLPLLDSERQRRCPWEQNESKQRKHPPFPFRSVERQTEKPSFESNEKQRWIGGSCIATCTAALRERRCSEPGGMRSAAGRMRPDGSGAGL